MATEADRADRPGATSNAAGSPASRDRDRLPDGPGSADTPYPHTLSPTGPTQITGARNRSIRQVVRWWKRVRPVETAISPVAGPPIASITRVFLGGKAVHHGG